METKKSKIAQIAYRRSYDGKYGLMYVYDAVLENGEWGELQVKVENKYKVGDEIPYTLESRIYNGKEIWSIKPQNENKGFGRTEDPQRQASIIRQSTMQMTIDLVCSGKINLNEFEKWQRYFESYAKNLK